MYWTPLAYRGNIADDCSTAKGTITHSNWCAGRAYALNASEVS